MALSLVLMGLAVAAPQGAQAQNQTGVGNVGSAVNQAGQLVMARIQAGNYVNSEGKGFGVQVEGNKVRLQRRNVSAHTELEITPEQVQNQTRVRLMTKLSNGRNAEIKVMPDTASETALERLRLRVCSSENNCTIELKEVGSGEQTRAAYEVQLERHARILGIFQAKMQVRTQVDAENGEVVRVGKPWWSFLATEPEETSE